MTCNVGEVGAFVADAAAVSDVMKELANKAFVGVLFEFALELERS